MLNKLSFNWHLNRVQIMLATKAGLSVAEARAAVAQNCDDLMPRPRSTAPSTWFFEPVGTSVIELRFFHFATVVRLMPLRLARIPRLELFTF